MILPRKAVGLTLGASALVLPLLLAPSAQATALCPDRPHSHTSQPVAVTPVETGTTAPVEEATAEVAVAAAAPAAVVVAADTSSPTYRWGDRSLNANQSRNARTIVAVVEQRGLSKRASVIALATAWQESDIQVLANPGVPQSLDAYHEALGHNATSVGIFQQQTGPGREVKFDQAAMAMDPAWSTNAFLDRMIKKHGNWESMSLGVVAVDAQDSAGAEAYGAWEDEAEALLSAIG